MVGIFAEDVMSVVAREECQRLAELATGVVALELGSQFGRSTIALASTATKVHSVDWHRGDPHAGKWHSLHGFMENIERHKVADKIIVHVGRNEEVLPLFTRQSFDLAFIDSFHERDAVLRDLNLVLAVMKPKAVIAFHDFGVFPGVTQVVKEFAQLQGVGIETVKSLAIVKLPS